MKIVNLTIVLMASLALVSCGAKKAAQETVVQQKPVVTYVQPGSDLLNAENVLRSWAVGVSDSEMTAKKKAVASASSQLAQMLEKAVSTTIEEYCVSLGESEVAKSKEFLSEKTKIVSDQVLSGARPIFDQWEPKDEKGMYRNYVVLELTGSDFIKKLIESMNEAQSANVKIDENLLNELFLKAINSEK